jgi:hypothetical protein
MGQMADERGGRLYATGGAGWWRAAGWVCMGEGQAAIPPITAWGHAPTRLALVRFIPPAPPPLPAPPG